MNRMPTASSIPDQHTLGLIVAGTGLLFMVEPVISLTSAATFQAINRARRQNRIAVLWPAGLVMLAWGMLCLTVSIPPRHAAQWFLLLIALPCVCKGLATLLFSTHLAKLSEDIEATDRVRRFKCGIGLTIGAVLIAWGLYLFRS